MEQAGMGLAVASLRGDGVFDVLKTHFADDTVGLYRGDGKGDFTDTTRQAGLAVETRYVSWGAAFPDLDNDGLPDIFVVTGNVYPDTERSLPAYPYRTPALLYRNLGGGRFEELGAEVVGPALRERHSSRGMAVADLNNDGAVDIVVWNRNEPPGVLRNDLKSTNHWLELTLAGTRSNRAAIGATVIVEADGRRQAQAVLSQTSFLSASDLRLHFGLGAARSAEVTVRWPTGARERFTLASVDRAVRLVEGEGAWANR
jgi:hypothetical protein